MHVREAAGRGEEPLEMVFEGGGPRVGGKIVNPDLALWLMVVASYGHLDRMPEAETEIRKILKTYPGFAISKAQMVPNWNDEHRGSFIEGLRKAGLPE